MNVWYMKLLSNLNLGKKPLWEQSSLGLHKSKSLAIQWGLPLEKCPWDCSLSSVNHLSLWCLHSERGPGFCPSKTSGAGQHSTLVVPPPAPNQVIPVKCS